VGYVAKTVSAASVKKGFFEANIFYIDELRVKAAAYEKYYDTPIDFTDIGYLDFRYYSIGIELFMRTTIGGVVKFANNSGGGAHWVHEIIDCTGIAGEQKLLCECHYSGSAVSCTHLAIIARAA